MDRLNAIYYDSREFPILGRIYVAGSEKGLVRLSLPGHPLESFFENVLKTFQPAFFTQHSEPFTGLYRELEQYLAGQRAVFDLPLDPRGTPFQLRVWEALMGINYGETTSYGEIARALERPKASRAVGQANHINPLPILIPCHRVIGVKGDLVGYGGGISLKKQLLSLEKNFRCNFLFTPL